MALVRTFNRFHMDRNSIHDEIDAKYCVFDNDGRTFIQINTHGRKTREIPNKVSQSIQLDKTGAEVLFGILKREFGFK